MKYVRAICAALLAASFAAGELSDSPRPHPPVYLGGYRVLQGDFHLHTLPLSAGTVTPWDLVRDAGHAGLDAIAVCGHNETWSGRMARWYAERFGGPTVLPCEEIHGPVFHIIAAGIHSTVSWRLSAADAIREVHRQGGVAIAAHPVNGAWPAFDAPAMALLDGSEVLQPIVYDGAQATADLRAFYARKPMAAIASSDWHGTGPPGICRTLLFVHQNTEAEILQAIRERRTVVYDRGQYFGDPALIELVRAGGPLFASPHESVLAPVSRTLAVAGLALLTLLCWAGKISPRPE